MALVQNALICAAIATLLWGVVGLSLALWLSLPRTLLLPVAPTLGWAVHSVIALPLFCLTGMASLSVVMASVVSMVAAGVLLWKRPHRTSDDFDISVPIPAFAVAAAFACAIMLAILPNISADGAALSQPVFDHAKVAMINDMARLGVPAGNPFFGEAGGFARLSYYYLWHFSAAEIALLTGLSGWEADAGMIGFTAFSSLLLMMGFAVWLSSRALSAGWVLLLAATTSIRPIAMTVLGADLTRAIIGAPSGFGTWAFQIFWAPQHVASANCVVIAIFLLVQLSRQQSLSLAIVLGLVVAAGFQSSTWVGGVTFMLAAATIAPLLMFGSEPRRRSRFIVLLAGAGLLAAGLATPFLLDQLKASSLRADGFPIALTPFEVLGDHTPAWVRSLLDVPAYWTVFLVAEFAAVYPAGLIAAAWLAKDQALTSERRRAVSMLALLVVVGLAIGGMLKSTTAANNDLAWRGVLPSLLMLVAFTAAGLGRYWRSVPPLVFAILIVPAGLALVQGLSTIHGYLVFKPQPSAERFLASTDMWAAVRKHTGIDERVANNPQYLADMTNWPINISWALLSNRRSCYAGSDLALPFAPLTRQRRQEVDAQFARVFSGATQADDLDQFAGRYDCAVVVLTPEDGAWLNDPLAKVPNYRLVETEPARWRIYRRDKNLDQSEVQR